MSVIDEIWISMGVCVAAGIVATILYARGRLSRLGTILPAAMILAAFALLGHGVHRDGEAEITGGQYDAVANEVIARPGIRHDVSVAMMDARITNREYRDIQRRYSQERTMSVDQGRTDLRLAMMEKSL